MLLALPCEAYFDVLLNRNKYIYIYISGNIKYASYLSAYDNLSVGSNTSVAVTFRSAELGL